MDLVRLNNRLQCRLSIVAVIIAVLLGLCGRSMSQISGATERIGCIDVNMTRTCFDIYNSSATWSDAWQKCQGNGGQLAILSTPETDVLVGQYMDRITANLEDPYAVWIGGRELNDSSWNWTDGKPFSMQNTSTVLTMFSTQAVRYENCATVGARQPDSTVIFQSSQCKTLRQFICQEANTTATTTTCQLSGNEGTIINGSCFAIISSSDPLSWFDSRYHCQTLGAELAVFNETSSSDLSAIYSLMPNATFFWIGLRKNPWIWVTGFDSAKGLTGVEEISHSGWESDVPYQKGRSCLGTDGRSGVSHGWVNLKCEDSYTYICQQITILTTTAAPTTAALTTVPNVTGAPPSNESTTAFYDYDSNFSMSPTDSSYQWNIVNVVVPIVIVAVVILVITFMIYCYFAQRRVGYVQQQ